ncbi:putative integral membrane protein [Fonsecaea pedrosoi]|nr:putative integral membrane protein [Fonsecaea pedrosoi]
MSASTTPRGPPDVSAMKARIITHMNADHQLSLRLYLQHYSHVPSPGTASAQMLDITTEHMIISSAYGRHVIQFEPPMKSLMEARERLVTMHELCLEQLDLSAIVVSKYVPPDRVWQWALSGLCLLIFTTFPFRESLRSESGSWIYQVWSLGGVAPWLAELSYTLAPAVLGVLVVVHGGEAVWFIQRKLRRHWVEWGSAAWWCWVVDCCIEGFGSFTRFDRIVKTMEMEKKGGGQH